ncbi:unnamed protein product [Ciceribacter sp. T2.26MG-112.2]|nr:unnamed protein product [Ciceribacter naphthalenivorans]
MTRLDLAKRFGNTQGGPKTDLFIHGLCDDELPDPDAVAIPRLGCGDGLTLGTALLSR